MIYSNRNLRAQVFNLEGGEEINPPKKNMDLLDILNSHYTLQSSPWPLISFRLVSLDYVERL